MSIRGGGGGGPVLVHAPGASLMLMMCAPCGAHDEPAVGGSSFIGLVFVSSCVGENSGTFVFT